MKIIYIGLGYVFRMQLHHRKKAKSSILWCFLSMILRSIILRVIHHRSCIFLYVTSSICF